MSTPQQDVEFIKYIIPINLLEKAINWITLNLEPEDIFSEEQLQYWATHNGFEKLI